MIDNARALEPASPEWPRRHSLRNTGQSGRARGEIRFNAKPEKRRRVEEKGDGS